MLREERLTAFLEDLQRGGGAAQRHLSPQFGRHRGVSGAEWVAREEGEFAGRQLGKVSIRFLDTSADGQQRFLVQDHSGKLVYEDRIGSDDQGLLVGDQAPVELISKLEFRQGHHPRRALACRAPHAPLLRVIPRDPAVTAVEQAEAAAQGADGFTRLWVTLSSDDFTTRTVSLRFYLQREAATLPVLLRGRDHPLFEPDHFARINGRDVTLAGDPERLWRITVILADGSTRVIDRQSKQSLHFEQPVRRVIVTDPLDNDWISDAEAQP